MPTWYLLSRQYFLWGLGDALNSWIWNELKPCRYPWSHCRWRISRKHFTKRGGYTTGKNCLRCVRNVRSSPTCDTLPCVWLASSFDEDTDYLSMERPSTILHMNAQASLFLQAVKAYCQRTRMRRTNSGIPKFPDCIIENGGKTGRVLIVGIVRGMMGRGLSTNISDNIVSYSKKCHDVDRAAIDLVWELYPLYQRWCANFVIPV